MGPELRLALISQRRRVPLKVSGLRSKTGLKPPFFITAITPCFVSRVVKRVEREVVVRDVVDPGDQSLGVPGSLSRRFVDVELA